MEETYFKSKHTLYRTFIDMHRRCYNPNRIAYKNYGAKGVIVCESWHSFENFIKDLGPKPTPKHTLDRIDPKGNYEPSNCRWITKSENSKNKNNHVWVTFNGETKYAADWGRELGINLNTLFSWHRRGQSLEEMFKLHLQK